MENKQTTRCHFIGIGGIGMSAIAQMANREGWVVSGSDTHESPSLDILRKANISIQVGHRASQVEWADVVVYSSSITARNVELIEARKLKKRILHRAEMLALLTKGAYAIAIAGSHGKTTTTGLVAATLEQTSMHPTVLVGGNFASFGGNFKSGRENVVVFEADESDSSFLHYAPNVILITNIDNDHLDTFGSLAGVKNAFCRFLDRLSNDGIWLGCYECEHTRDLLLHHGRAGIAYGFSDLCKYQAKAIESHGIEGISFDIYVKGVRLDRVRIEASGMHNVLNALGACALALETGCSIQSIKEGLVSFTRPARRAEIKFASDDLTLIDDYAHHPTEIIATIRAIHVQVEGDFCVIFQPHRYSRTFLLNDEFVKAFKNVPHVIITDIYAAGEESIEGVSGELLANQIRQTHQANVEYIPRQDLEKYLSKENIPETLWITMGAGDIGGIATRVAKAIQCTV